MFKVYKNFDNKLFLKFIVPYIFILAVPLVMGFGVYRIAANIVKEDIKESNISMLNQSKNIVEKQLQQIDHLSVQLATNDKLVSLFDLKEPLLDSDYLKIKDVIEELNKYTSNMDYLSGYYIYLKNSNYIITQDTLYKADIYYNMVLKFKDSEYKTWVNMLMSNHFAPEYVSLKSYDVKGLGSNNTNFIQSVPFGYNEKPMGAITISFENEKIKELISYIDISKGGFVYVENKQGELITSLPENMNLNNRINSKELTKKEGFFSKNIDGKKMMVTYITSKERGWKYVIVLPSDLVFANLDSFTFITVKLFLITLLVGILVASILAYRNSKPVFDIVKQLKQFNSDESVVNKNTFSSINGSVSNLILTNNELQKDIDNQKSLIHSAFLEKLIRGQIYNEAEFLATSAYVGIDISKGKSIVILLKVFNNESTVINLNDEIIKELNISKAIIRGVLTKHFTGNVFFHDIDQQTIAIILNSDIKDTEVFYKEIEDNVTNVKKELLDNINLKVDASGGEPYSNPLELWHSFEQAVHALDNFDDKYSIVWSHNLEIETENYYYPLDVEQKLSNHTKIGDKGQVNKLLDFIYYENFETRNLNSCKSYDVVKELKSTIRKMLPDFKDNEDSKNNEDIKGVNNILREVNSKNSYDVNFKLVANAYYSLCDLILVQKGNSNLNLMNKIKRYIESNYMDKNLCLYKVSSEFNLSEGYFSHLFKEQTDINFTDYLEKTRLNNANILLKNRELTITGISEMVGYNSAQSFRRAFKRLFGVSPTDVRKN
ncbi:AraC family transcriptional regulator [Clostridium estertheticum]|uniref:AraC family transcriptional regulator n=1 Tax=Clostridium estertheticum TaxID=238834 RepID=A0AA47EEI9_9CLOT|nr:helix-turn-helix domain-containing protein [Clostridium estertheticum]MBU3156116.1 AraC family transcriptional regulator [Clostridium estertheticum]WAG58556.1 AraC family transcriptional regulator [Clostridium estertheticum]